jgi:hypothetical protein
MIRVRANTLSSNAVSNRSPFRILVLVAAIASCATLRAGAQSWTIDEVFSNSSGTIQYIELTTTAASDFSLNGLSLAAASDGVPAAFSFTHNLGGQPTTTDRTFLIATPGFALLPGAVTPDFGTLPTSFFDPNAGSITLGFAGLDSFTFPGAFVPQDSLHALNRHIINGATHLDQETNTPTNFAGAGGRLGPVGADFDNSGTVNSGDLFLWDLGFGFPSGAGQIDGDADADRDVDATDFLSWQRDLGWSQATPAVRVASAAVPEPTAGLLALAAFGALGWARRRMAK